MSGSFNDIDVPPTLVSFAVDVNKEKNIISPELKKAGSRLVLLKIHRDADEVPDFEETKEQYSWMPMGWYMRFRRWHSATSWA